MEIYEAEVKFLDYLENVQNYKPKTLKDHRLILRDFKKYLYFTKKATYITIKDVTIKDVIDYLDDVSKKPVTSASRYY